MAIIFKSALKSEYSLNQGAEAELSNNDVVSFLTTIPACVSASHFASPAYTSIVSEITKLAVSATLTPFGETTDLGEDKRCFLEYNAPG